MSKVPKSLHGNLIGRPDTNIKLLHWTSILKVEANPQCNWRQYVRGYDWNTYAFAMQWTSNRLIRSRYNIYHVILEFCAVCSRVPRSAESAENGYRKSADSALPNGHNLSNKEWVFHSSWLIERCFQRHWSKFPLWLFDPLDSWLALGSPMRGDQLRNSFRGFSNEIPWRTTIVRFLNSVFLDYVD